MCLCTKVVVLVYIRCHATNVKYHINSRVYRMEQHEGQLLYPLRDKLVESDPSHPEEAFRFCYHTKEVTGVDVGR